MPRSRIQIVPHLEYAELTRRYRRCRNGAERTRWLGIRLLSRPGNPIKVEQVAEITGLSAAWVRKIARRYNEKVRWDWLMDMWNNQVEKQEL